MQDYTRKLKQMTTILMEIEKQTEQDENIRKEVGEQLEKQIGVIYNKIDLQQQNFDGKIQNFDGEISTIKNKIDENEIMLTRVMSGKNNYYEPYISGIGDKWILETCIQYL